ncbi:aminotransferase class I/II-fold pyridoxal phosphate-dependent enzyme [Pseudolysinimonas yzui]|uniref:DegT/DnrJ/EryC1/StrS aminotransferase family protein n=1 Tax=Pseudolysinimonas yzui TaxID=2708254 RepID=A0A8J3GQD6_9MICO|nr:aminotransferase class I/II-fold pyridoxal phosphate-dependent enzyme [Pseudolysinimonas yzui]GHF14639.1 hypothetical protein GCM10011600_14480 [Pseudolysinimonas yzui]
MAIEHPDREWIERTIASLEAWLRTDVDTPTSQITGGGAIGRVEARLSALHSDRPVVLMPSATGALHAVLSAVGVGPGDEVLIPDHDWTSSLAVVRMLGATPVAVPVDPTTLTIDPAAALVRLSAATRAVIATHLFGIAADVPALRVALPGVVIVEDCAQALGSTLDDRPVGSLGDAAVLSMGPGKRLDVGELGALVLCDADLRTAVLRVAAHPVRQRLGGVRLPRLDAFAVRPHPLAAVLLDAALSDDDPGAVIEAHRRTARALAARGVRVLGADERRGVAANTLVLAPDRYTSTTIAAHVGHVDVIDIGALASGSSTLRRYPVVAVDAPVIQDVRG